MGLIQTLDGDFFKSPQYRQAMTYNKEFETLADVKSENILDKSGVWYHPYNLTYKGITGDVPITVSVNGSDETGYQVKAIGVYSQVIADELLFDISTGLGAKWDRYSDGFIEMSNNFTNEFQDLSSTITDGVRYVKDNIVEWVNNYMVDKYGDTPVNSKYYRTQTTYPEEYGILTDWDNSKIADGIASLVSDGLDIPMSADLLNENIKELVENDPRLQNILNKPITRTLIIRLFSQEQQKYYIRMCINGYTINNNAVVTTTESGKNQHYGVLGMTCTGVKYETLNSNNQTFEQVEHWENAPMETGVVFYNYVRDKYAESYDDYGGGTRTTRYWDKVFDTIGVISGQKPYDTYPNGGLWTKQPDNTYKVGYPEDDEPDDNEPVRNGDPVPPNIVINTHYIVGVPPIPEPDPYKPVPWDNETPQSKASGMYNVFEVGDSHLKSLNGVLWDTSVIAEIKKAFTNNPLDAIISLHEVYYHPQLDVTAQGITNKNIWLGAYNTHVLAPIIPQRYQKIKFNPIPLNKQFKNIRDYQRDVVVYLPFIGFRQLDVTDICGNTSNSSIYIEYTVDNITGDCVVVLYINKDGNIDKKPLYMFNGNCASELPMTGADRSNLLSASLSAIGGVASTVLTGGATAPNLVGNALNLANSMGMSIDRSGNITGNHGAMLFKNPFLIINYPIPFDAHDFKHYSGGASNVTTTLKYCQGFTRMSDCIIDTIPCTSTEGDSIKSLLSNGVII